MIARGRRATFDRGAGHTCGVRHETMALQTSCTSVRSVTPSNHCSGTAAPVLPEASRATLEEIVHHLGAARHALVASGELRRGLESLSQLPAQPATPLATVTSPPAGDCDDLDVGAVRWRVMPTIWRAFASVACDHVRRGSAAAPTWIGRLAEDLGTATQVRELRDRWRLSRLRREAAPSPEATAPSALVRQAIASRMLLAYFAGVRFVDLGSAVGVSRRTAERLCAAHELGTIRRFEVRQALAVSAQRLALRMLTCLGQPPALLHPFVQASDVNWPSVDGARQLNPGTPATPAHHFPAPPNAPRSCS